MNIKQMLTLINRTIGRKGQSIKYIVIHYTGNNTDRAVSNAKFFRIIPRGASAHYFVDTEEIYQVVKDTDSAWAVGKKYGNAPYWGLCTNYNSISIEMCSNGGRIDERTIDLTIELTKELMRKYGVPSDRVIRHYDVCHKQCPGWNGWIGANENFWNGFKARLNGQTNRCMPIAENHEIKADNDPKREVIKWGQAHSNNFLEHKIVADGIVGKETKKQMVRVLQHGLNLDYGAKLVEDGILGNATIRALGNHYVQRGEKQYMVTVAEILCNMHGIRTDVECAGIFGAGLERSAGASKLNAQWFIDMVR